MIDIVESVPGAPEELLVTLLNDAMATHGQRPFSEVMVSLAIYGDDVIAEMNASFLDHEGPTDVLAFEQGFDDPESGLYYLGDIAINADLAKREALQRHIPWEEELVLYATHGMLHLLGFRDKTDEERAAVRAAERELLSRHGITPHWDGE